MHHEVTATQYALTFFNYVSVLINGVFTVSLYLLARQMRNHIRNLPYPYRKEKDETESPKLD